MNSLRVCGFPPWRWLLLGLVWCIAFLRAAHAQEHLTLVSFTNTWKYNQAGENLGTAWVAPDYDDSAAPWQSGPALFGLEPAPLPGFYNAATFTPNIIPTPLSLFSDGGTNGTNITFYFRTKFICDLTNVAGVELWATNLVDDGCVIFLNGTRAGNVRMPGTNESYLTYSSGIPANEGQFDNVLLPASLLFPGTNSLAVEFHQSFLSSSDVAFAMHLVAIISSPLAVTSVPPAALTVSTGEPVTLTVQVSGSPAFFQWQRNGVNISGETNASLAFPFAIASMAGTYRCVVTNSISAVTSTPTVVSIVADLTGPRPLEARVLESGATNVILLFFDESMPSAATSPNRDTNNYRIIASGTTNQFVTVTNALVSGTNILLRVNAASNWTVGSDYYVVLNNLVDARTNVIAPNTVVPISWPRHVVLLAPDAVWKYNASAVASYAVYSDDWTSPEYVEGPDWIAGTGVFHGGTATPPECSGPTPTFVALQPEPILFRTAFQWPPTNGARARLSMTMASVRSGIVLFLNGREVYRTNVFGGVSAFTRASGFPPVNTPCLTVGVDVINLLPGTNWIAAASVQWNNDVSFMFGLNLSALANLPGSVPENPPPILQTSTLGDGTASLSWTGYGYVLESSTNLALGFESYPSGPWVPVANMSNPYTNIFTSPERFFRLKK